MVNPEELGCNAQGLSLIPLAVVAHGALGPLLGTHNRTGVNRNVLDDACGLGRDFPPPSYPVVDQGMPQGGSLSPPAHTVPGSLVTLRSRAEAGDFKDFSNLQFLPKTALQCPPDVSSEVSLGMSAEEFCTFSPTPTALWSIRTLSTTTSTRAVPLHVVRVLQALLQGVDTCSQGVK